MIKTLILDFDGTLADTKAGIIQTVQATLDCLNIPKADEHKIKNLAGLSLRETFSLATALTENSILDKAIELYREKYAQISRDTVKLFPDVKEVLEKLFDRGIIITVASGKGKDALTVLLDRLEISRYMTMVLGEQDVKNGKPAPDMALLILEKTKSAPEETLVVGDTVYDIAMGKEAGCITCGVSYGNHPEVRLAALKPDFIIGGFAEIVEILGE
jgi:phosphoglycolate phosphatase